MRTQTINTTVQALEELGRYAIQELRRQGTTPTADAVHRAAVVEFFRQRLDDPLVPRLYESLLEWRPVLNGSHTRPYRLCRDAGRRRATNSFFTPPAVVDYLVEQTLGPLLTPGTDILRLRIVDPAAGAGCFLLAAAAFLARSRAKGDLTEWRRRVIEQCLFGMDIDPLAVELTRLRLAAAAGQPDLACSIRCGDALAEEWPGRFDAVLGNPPWGRCRPTPALRKRFSTLQPRHANLSVPFTELGLRLSENGRLGFVLPSPWLEIESCRRLRELLASTRRIESLVQAHQLFGPAVDCVLLVVGGRGPTETFPLHQLDERRSVAGRLEQLRLRAWSGTRRTFLPLANRVKPVAYVHVRIGVQEYALGGGRPPQTAGLIAARAFHSLTRTIRDYVRFVPCGDVQRFRLAWSGGYLDYGDHLHCPRDRTIFTREHLLLSRIFDVRRRVFKCCHVPARDGDFWCNNTDSFNVWLAADAPLTLFALLGVLGSRWLGRLAFDQFVNLRRQVFPKVSVRMARDLPLPEREWLTAKKGQTIAAELDTLVRRITAEGLSSESEHGLERSVARLYGQTRKAAENWARAAKPVDPPAAPG